MANTIAMKNTTTGEIRNGFTGFSWTTLFFWAFPAIFRMDFVTFIVVFLVTLVLSATTMFGGAILVIVWAFLYNRYYTISLIRKGYKFNGTHEENKAAAMILRIELNANNCLTTEPVPQTPAPAPVAQPEVQEEPVQK